MTMLERIAMAALADMGRAAEKTLRVPAKLDQPVVLTRAQFMAHYHDESRSVH